tara:strand:+ start:94 stop:1128 length:1035 start_codon:yes stop_codon:yes gene_type:complete
MSFVERENQVISPGFAWVVDDQGNYLTKVRSQASNDLYEVSLVTLPNDMIKQTFLPHRELPDARIDVQLTDRLSRIIIQDSNWATSAFFLNSSPEPYHSLAKLTGVSAKKEISWLPITINGSLMNRLFKSYRDQNGGEDWEILFGIHSDHHWQKQTNFLDIELMHQSSGIMTYNFSKGDFSTRVKSFEVESALGLKGSYTLGSIDGYTFIIPNFSLGSRKLQGGYLGATEIFPLLTNTKVQSGLTWEAKKTDFNLDSFLERDKLFTGIGIGFTAAYQGTPHPVLAFEFSNEISRHPSLVSDRKVIIASIEIGDIDGLSTHLGLHLERGIQNRSYLEAGITYRFR